MCRPGSSGCAATPAADDGSLLTLKLRYKEDFRFAASVAAFGMVLRDSPHKGSAELGRVLEWAQDAARDDPDGRRAEFGQLVAKAWAAQAR